MKLNRLNEIEKYIRQTENVSLDTLCDVFKVSKNTIRRDVAELESKGIIKKVYGGITLSPPATAESAETLVPFELRELEHMEEKKQIAKLAAELIENGDVIFIDSGTTTKHIVPFLADKKNLTIVTSSLHVITAAIPYPHLDIISTGGVFYRAANTFTGVDALKFLNNYNISKAFLASTGVSLARGVTSKHTIPFEYEIKKFVMENSTTTAVLVDHSKLDVASLMTYCRLEDVDFFITDTLPPQEYINFFAANNVKLLTP